MEFPGTTPPQRLCCLGPHQVQHRDVFDLNRLETPIVLFHSCLCLKKGGMNFRSQTASGARRNGSTAEKQGPEVAAARLLLPPPPVPPSAPPTASVTFALCSSCRVLWKGHLQLLAALKQRREHAMWWESAATGRKRGHRLDSYPLTT